MMDEKQLMKFAVKAVREIEEDILDRRGLKWELQGCDPDIRREIRRTWALIIMGKFRVSQN